MEFLSRELVLGSPIESLDVIDVSSQQFLNTIDVMFQQPSHDVLAVLPKPHLYLLERLVLLLLHLQTVLLVQLVHAVVEGQLLVDLVLQFHDLRGERPQESLRLQLEVILERKLLLHQGADPPPSDPALPVLLNLLVEVANAVAGVEVLEHVPEIGELLLQALDEHLEGVLHEVLVLVDVLLVEALQHVQPLDHLRIFNDRALLLVVAGAGVAEEGVGDDAAGAHADPLAPVLAVEAERLVMHNNNQLSQSSPPYLRTPPSSTPASPPTHPQQSTNGSSRAASPGSRRPR